MTTPVLPLDVPTPAPPGARPVPPAPAAPPPAGGGGPGTIHPGRPRRGPARLWRGRRGDPPWVRPALLVLLGATAALYLWDLGASGWANSFYAAAVQAGTKSWKAFFFGSSDAANFITVDKPPASLWVMELSARIFGLSSWSLLVPQALEGVAAVAVLYAAVRRSVGRAGPALVAGAVLATTPVAALMFRYDNPDALLVLLLTVGAYATVRALERASTWWLVLAMAAVGTGFITKMLQAFLVVPAFALVYLLAAPTPLRRRLVQLAAAGVALVVSAGWWVAAVQLTPAADRPYIGGSQDNSVLNLVFGYNGFGRLSGNESGSVGGAATGGSRWGPTGVLRFFSDDFGADIAWLIPAAVILAVACLWLWRRRARSDAPRAGMVLWAGWLVVTEGVISLAQGIIHPYYSVAVAPAVGAMVGIGAGELWEHRRRLWVRLCLAGTLVVTVAWAAVVLERASSWMPWLAPAVVALGVAAAVGIVAGSRRGGALAAAVGAAAVVSALAAPAAYALDTAATPHQGAIPSAGPATTAGFGAARGGPGAGGFPGARPGAAAGSGTRAPASSGAGAGFPGTAAGGLPGAQGSAGTPPAGGFPAVAGGAGAAPGSSRAAAPGAGGPGPSGRSGAGGGFLSATTPGKALVRALERDAARYTWVAATVNSNSAAGYQLATGDPVMAIGGFNGTDPAPTLTQFETDVAEGRIHYFIAGGGGGPGGGTGTTATAITRWVESHFSATTVDGVTLYDFAAR